MILLYKVQPMVVHVGVAAPSVAEWLQHTPLAAPCGRFSPPRIAEGAARRFGQLRTPSPGVGLGIR